MAHVMRRPTPMSNIRKAVASPVTGEAISKLLFDHVVHGFGESTCADHALADGAATATVS